MNLPLFQLALNGFGVRRFHTIPHVVTQETVGHHTAGVMAIIFCLYDQDPPLRLVRAALYHDVSEWVTGDIPATAKWDFPALKEASERAEEEVMGAAGLELVLDLEEAHVLKFADMLSLVIKAHDEVLCGNSFMLVVRRNGIEACLSMLHDTLSEFRNAHDLFETLLEGWRNVEPK